MASKTTEIESQNFENGRPVSQCYSMLPHRSLGLRVFEGRSIPGFQAQAVSDSPTTDSKINLKPGHLEYGNW